jgi:glycerol uptake facilitator-like aquaporin
MSSTDPMENTSVPEDKQSKVNLRAMGAEMAGVAIFTFIVLQTTNSWEVAIGLLAVIIAVNPFSGAHLNPGVTAGQYMAGKLAGDVAIKYILAQVIGGLFGGALWYILKGHKGVVV